MPRLKRATDTIEESNEILAEIARSNERISRVDAMFSYVVSLRGPANDRYLQRLDGLLAKNEKGYSNEFSYDTCLGRGVVSRQETRAASSETGRE